MTNQEILEIFKKTKALLEGHFLLTSGKHSNKYFQCAQVLQYPEYLNKICTLIYEYFKLFEIDTVISPAIGGICVGQEVGRLLNKRFIFAEREDKEMTLRRGFTLSPGEKVLVCEDVITTGGSVFEVIKIVKSYGAEVVGVASIVDRSNGTVKFESPQFSALTLEVIIYPPDDCPLCKENIPLMKPGSRKKF
ncbi:MAG: orotate phosphoribosyltransferase [Ignavibacteriales bacterium]|nr:orotate phosphoribosyltransferase [Ignavibacteriales bacterium]